MLNMSRNFVNVIFSQPTSGFLILLTIYLTLTVRAQDHKRVDEVAGFLIHRIVNGEAEYLLLKHAKNGRWAPPKGNREGKETIHQTAVRETKDDSGLAPDDYEEKSSKEIDFEYETPKGILKKVTLWLAEVKDPHQPIQINEEEEEAYAWLEFSPAYKLCTEHYKESLKRGELLRWSIWSAGDDRYRSGDKVVNLIASSNNATTKSSG